MGALDHIAQMTQLMDENEVSLLIYSTAKQLFEVHGVSKNAPTLASCIFDKHGLILIIFSKQHQHTFRTMCVQLSLSHQFYLLYLLLNNCDGNNAF